MHTVRLSYVINTDNVHHSDNNYIYIKRRINIAEYQHNNKADAEVDT